MVGKYKHLQPHIIIMDKNQYTRNSREVLASSILSSIVSTVVTNPIEVAKLNFQYFPLACQYYPHQSYRQLIACQCSRFSIQGSLQSLKIALPQVLFSNIIFMQLYEQLREYLVNTASMSSTASTLSASIMGRTIVTSANIPFESLRIRLSNQVKNKGINFHGYKIMLARDIIYSGMFWTLFESYRNYSYQGEYRGIVSSSSQHFSWKNFTTNLIPGFIIGSFVSALTTPLDTLKTRVQSQGITNYSIISGIRNIYSVEGLMGLFSGVEWRVLKNGMHTSLYLFIYEWSLRRWNAKHSPIAQLEEP